MSTAKYLWLDLETTGLKSAECTVLEVAVILTDEQFVEIDRKRKVIAHDQNHLMMSDWCWKQHTKSGLLDELWNVHGSQNLQRVDEEFCRWINEVHDQSLPPLHLAGSSIHFDRGFMENDLPGVLSMLHYRQFDVSSLMISAPDLWGLELPPHDKPHRAAGDVENSLALARFFKERLKAT